MADCVISVVKQEGAAARIECGSFFVRRPSQSPGLPEALATAYNPGMCLLALPVIVQVIVQVLTDSLSCNIVFLKRTTNADWYRLIQNDKKED